MNTPQKTSEQVSREWAESLLIYLDRASYEYRHWDTTVDMLDEAERRGATFWSSHTSEEARKERDNAFLRFLNHRSSFACKE